MPIFGLVTEGCTDQAIIKNVINGLAQKIIGDEVDWSVAQPEVGAGKQISDGGWERLFGFLANRDLITDALMRADFVIVLVDSDCAEHKNFGVSLHLGGARRPTSEIVKDVEAVLVSKVPGDVFAQFGHKFLFAVAVNSIECWLLPLYGKKRSLANEQSCERKLVVELTKAGHAERYVVRRELKLKKEYDLFLELGQPYYEDIDVRDICNLSESFEIFIANATAKLTSF